MKFTNWCVALGLALSAIAFPSAVQARRTAIDQTPGGTPIFYSLGGYCDLNGDDCDPDSSGARLGYDVSIGGSDFSNKIFVTGNGVLSFGVPVDFLNSLDLGQPGVGNKILDSDDVSLADYDLNLVSVGQSNDTTFHCLGFFCDNSQVFLQSATVSVRADGTVAATWFTCFVPDQNGGCPQSNVQKLTLTPTELRGQTGFYVRLGGPGASNNGDAGYAINGVETLASGPGFFLPALFQGNVTLSDGVPEPATWGMMILGFGAIGASLRRRRTLLAA